MRQRSMHCTAREGDRRHWKFLPCFLQVRFSILRKQKEAWAGEDKGTTVSMILGMICRFWIVGGGEAQERRYVDGSLFSLFAIVVPSLQVDESTREMVVLPWLLAVRFVMVHQWRKLRVSGLVMEEIATRFGARCVVVVNSASGIGQFRWFNDEVGGGLGLLMVLAGQSMEF
ncbi:hypothetical protein V8G54_035344 [Vigna mungo]|uniref:Uncharacterized protein n=1 Tax=Vigna mungo TaxID=3915 RepID=A0AAQ3RFL3_VIGMU